MGKAVAVGDRVALVVNEKHTTGKVLVVHNPASIVDVQYGPAGFEKIERTVSRQGDQAPGKPYWYPQG